MINEIAKLVESKTSFVMSPTESLRTLQTGVYLQSSPDDCILVRDAGGGDVYFSLPDRVDKIIQIISRAVKYATAEAQIIAVYEALHGKAGLLLPVLVSGRAWVANVIEAQDSWQYIGPDEEGRHEFALNLIFKLSMNL